MAPGRASQSNARLLIRPQFVVNDSTAGDMPGDIDSIEIIVTRPPDTTAVARVGIAIEADQDSIMIPVTIPLEGASTAYHVRFVALGDGAPLYSGEQDVTVTAIPSSPAPIVAVYVGPGRNIRTVTISPATAQLGVGDSISFTWSGTDSAGNALPPDSIPARWATSDSTVARVSAAGVARGVRAGTARIVLKSVASASIRDTATLTITEGAPAVASLAVAPGWRVMLAGDTVTLVVAGKDAQGQAAVPASLTYTSRTPAVATVSAAGKITAVAAGRAVVVVQAPGATGTVADSLAVVVPAAGSAVVSALGGSRAFATARVGDTVTVVVAVDLRAVAGQRLGSYNAQLDWNPAVMQYVRSDSVAGGFGLPTLNETQTSTGQLRFGSAQPSGASGTIGLVAVRFVGAAAGSTPLALTLTDLSAAITFANLLPAAVVVPGNVTIH
jgi:hypothetical protein